MNSITQKISTGMDREFDTLDDLLKSRRRTVLKPGEILTVRDKGYRFAVADKDAEDFHCQTEGGERLCAVPNNLGQVSTAQLGWVLGSDFTENLTRFMANPGARTRVLVICGRYLVSGGPYQVPEQITGIVSADYDSLEHGELAEYGFDFLDRSPESAAANGVTYLNAAFFIVPSGFKMGGLRFDHNVRVDPLNPLNLNSINGGAMVLAAIGPKNSDDEQSLPRPSQFTALPSPAPERMTPRTRSTNMAAPNIRPKRF